MSLSIEQQAIKEIQAFDPGKRTVWPDTLNLGEIDGGELVYKTVTYVARGIGDDGIEIPTGRIESQPALAIRKGDLTRPLVYSSDFKGQEGLVLQVLDRIAAFRDRA